MSETIFSKIIRKEIPAKIEHEDDLCLVFHDIAPKAPVHLLAIPKKPIRSMADVTAEDQAIMGHLMLVIREVSEKMNLSGGFRIVANTGFDGGQEVEHLHFHILGGRKLSWPPG